MGEEKIVKESVDKSAGGSNLLALSMKPRPLACLALSVSSIKAVSNYAHGCDSSADASMRDLSEW